MKIRKTVNMFLTDFFTGFLLKTFIFCIFVSYVKNIQLSILFTSLTRTPFFCDYNHKMSHLVEKASCMWATLRQFDGVRVNRNLFIGPYFR